MSAISSSGSSPSIGGATPYNGSGAQSKRLGGEPGTQVGTTGSPIFGYYRISRTPESLMPWITVQPLAGELSRAHDTPYAISC
jgi:hypothetical protein